jgi:hypothetical protein
MIEVILYEGKHLLKHEILYFVKILFCILFLYYYYINLVSLPFSLSSDRSPSLECSLLVHLFDVKRNYIFLNEIYNN